jgi:hypothetical protein
MTDIDRPRFPERAETQALAHAMRGAPLFDPADYRADLADMNLSEAQEAELLEILWSMMSSFARMGFEVDVCGLIFEGFNLAAGREASDGKLDQSTQKETPSKDGSGGAP